MELEQHSGISWSEVRSIFWDAAAAESGSSPTEDGFYPEYLQISDVQTLILTLLCLFRLHFGSFI